MEQAKQAQPEQATTSASPERDSAQIFVMASIVHQKSYVTFAEDLTPYLLLDVDKRVYESVKERVQKGERLPISVLYSMESADEIKDLTEFEFMTADEQPLARKYVSSVSKMKIRYFEKEKTALASDYEKTKDITLLQRMMKIDKTLRSLKNGENND